MSLIRAQQGSSVEQSDFRYATAYSSDTEAHLLVEGYGVEPIFANGLIKSNEIVAGGIVRLICEMSDNEIIRRDDGVIVMDHKFPSTEGMTLRKRVSNRLEKTLQRITRESHKTTYTPILDSELSQQELVRLEGANEAWRKAGEVVASRRNEEHARKPLKA